MKFEFLKEHNVEKYIDYLITAFEESPEEMVAERLDAEQIRKRVRDDFYRRTFSILALDGENVIGQIEYHFYGCIQDGAKMAYVDWIHVLKSHRRRGTATALFKEFESECLKNGINQYYLIQSESEEASSFYGTFAGSFSSRSLILRKFLI